MSRVFTNGCFDLFHVGHLCTLTFAHKLSLSDGRYAQVIVGLNSDKSVRLLKGDSRPIIPQEQRKLIVQSIRFVDEVILFDEETPIQLIKNVKPDFIVKGVDYNSMKVEDIVGADLAPIVIVPSSEFPSTSTSKIIQRIRGE